MAHSLGYFVYLVNWHRNAICHGATRSGNHIRVTTRHQFFYGRSPQIWPDRNTPLASDSDADYFIELANNSPVWNGQIGRYTFDINISRGWGINVFVGPGTFGGGEANYIFGALYLTRTGLPDVDQNFVNHEFGHDFGLPHSGPGQSPNVMDASAPSYAASQVATEAHVERFIRMCRL